MFKWSLCEAEIIKHGDALEAHLLLMTTGAAGVPTTAAAAASATAAYAA
jgi:hypothetical protein